MRRLIVAALLLTAGCGPVLVGNVGDAEKLDGAFKVCGQETFMTAFVPDFGVSAGLSQEKCMREFGWEAVPGKRSVAGYRWVGR